jgi:hypothetical protein
MLIGSSIDHDSLPALLLSVTVPDDGVVPEEGGDSVNVWWDDLCIVSHHMLSNRSSNEV